MLKLLIAEDEALERKALHFLLDKHYSQCIEIVDEVSNGRDAVERALSLRPDIILMDINMPILDGLEASNIIKEQCENTELIILTAFNYFDYAKKAINIGVSDYLLKPFSNEEFFHSVDKVIEKAGSKIANETKNQKLKKNYSKIVPYIEKQIIADIVFGVSITEAKFKEYMEILNIKSAEFCCILFSIDAKGVFDERSVNTIKNKLNILFKKSIVGLCLNNIVAFIFDEALGSKILGARFEDLLSDLSYALELKKDENLEIGVGCINEDTDKLYLSYKEAKRSIISKPISKSIEKKHVVIDTYNILCGKIINEDLNEAIIEFNNILSPLVIKKESCDFLAARSKISNMLTIVIENINEFTGRDFKDFDKDKVLRELTDLNEFADIKSYASMIIKNLIGFIKSYKRSKNIDVVEKVKKYIEENYMNEISLETLAQHVSMSTFYLSRIFSKTENVQIREYIIKIRMEKAKNMLQHKNIPIKKIAMDVGYSDVNYFSKAFKKYEKISPKQYVYQLE